MRIIEANDPTELISSLSFYDCIIFTCQCMWHLKDWVLNDEKFGAKDNASLEKDIHSAKCLLMCADIANGSKHLKLSHTNTEALIADETGIHIDSSRGIFKEFYYITHKNTQDRFYRMEIREFLRECRDTWEKIINMHYLSIVDVHTGLTSEEQ